MVKTNVRVHIDARFVQSFKISLFEVNCWLVQSAARIIMIQGTGQKCINTIGTYDCGCDEGYECNSKDHDSLDHDSLIFQMNIVKFAMTSMNASRLMLAYIVITN